MLFGALLNGDSFAGCGQNGQVAKFSNVKAGGTDSCHCALKVSKM